MSSDRVQWPLPLRIGNLREQRGERRAAAAVLADSRILSAQSGLDRDTPREFDAKYPVVETRTAAPKVAITVS